MNNKLTKPDIKPISKKIVDAVTTFEREAGGRGALIEQFMAVSDPEMENVVGQIADPANDHLSLAQICALAGVSLNKLLKFYKESANMQAQLKAYHKVYKHLPKVTEDIMEAALTTTKLCHRCYGACLITVSYPTLEDSKGTREVECNGCGGMGRIKSEPDTKVREMALQLGGMLKVPGSPTVNVNTQINNQNAYTSEDFKNFRSASDRILYPGKSRQSDTIDAEVKVVESIEVEPSK